MVGTEVSQSFFLSGGEDGMLFIHGLTGSSKEMEPMARFYNERGFTCLGIKLKGHETDPDDLSRYCDIDWIHDAIFGYDMLKSRCKRVYICGVSMGGSLGLYLAENFGVDGVICMSAPVYVYLKGAMPAARVIKHIKKFIAATPSNSIARTIAPGYDRIPLSTIDSLYRLMKNVKKRITKVNCPTFVAQSRADRIVKCGSAQFIYDNISSKQKELLWLNSPDHIVNQGRERDVVFQRSYSFIKSLN